MFEDLTLFQMAQRQIDYLARRQSLLSQNVANANSPQYQVKDLAPVSFKDLMAPQAVPLPANASPELARASLNLNPSINPGDFEPAEFKEVKVLRPEESKPDGNQVLIEDQMQKIGDIKNKYELAVNLMMKNMSMFKTAIDKGA